LTIVKDETAPARHDHSMMANTPALFRAPHRGFFLLGTAGLVTALAAWLSWMLWPWPLTAPPGWAHGWVMMFGALGPFMGGFLFTAYSRWMSAPPPARSTWLSSLALQSLGLVGLFAGGGGTGILTASGTLLLLAGWLVLCGHLLQVLRVGKGGYLHPVTMFVVVSLAPVTLALMLLWSMTGDARWALSSLVVGQWGFLLGVYLVVAHRMIPFFAGCKLEEYTPYRPPWILLTALSLAGLHGVLQLNGELRWLWLADLPLGLLATWLLVRWQAWRARPHRLLLTLFLAWSALAAGLTLSGAQSLYLWSTGNGFGGRGPAHLISIGFFGAMVLAMGTRVTLGHSGRPLHMGTRAWLCFLGVLAAACLRLVAESLPGREHWLVLSALCWLIAAVLWAIRFAPMLWRPRRDGSAG
jgi:uncharacterized protein involved in response to NO